MVLARQQRGSSHVKAPAGPKARLRFDRELEKRAQARVLFGFCTPGAVVEVSLASAEDLAEAGF